MNRTERLEKILNKTTGNPNHDKEGKFTFAPYKKYPMLEKTAKKLSLLKKSEKGLTEKYLEQVDIEREKLFKKYKQDKELEDDELSKWNDGWYMWDEKDKAKFSDIDIALSKAIFKESKSDIDVYRTQVDSKNPGKMSKAEYASWSPDLRYTADWAKFLAGYNSKVDVFKAKVTLDNLKIMPDVLYSQRFLRNKAKYKEYILSNKTSIDAIDKNLSYDELKEKYLNFIITENGGPGSGNFNPGQGRGVGKPGNKTPKSNPSEASNLDEHKKYEKAVHKLPKERRTKHQLEIIHSLDNMGVLSEEMSKWLRLYGDEETLGAIEKGLSDAEEIGLDLSNIHLERLRTGSKIWGRAWASGKIAFVGQFYDGNPKKLWRITYPSGGFHTNDSIMGLVRHEIGHQISYQNARDKRLQKDKPKNIWQGDEISNYCGEVISKAMGYQFFSYSETLKDLQKMSNSDISKYGRTNFNEAIAESWSNPDYSEFTKKVSNILREDSMSKTKINSLNKIEKDIPLCTGYGPEFEDDEEVLSRNQRLDFILNGGPGSGNPNPGQGRGIGKPNNSSSKTISTMNYDKMVEDGSEKWRDTALNLSIQLLDEIEKNHPELIDKEKQERNLENNYKEYERWQDKGDRVHNLSYDEYKEKVISKEIDSDGFKFSDYHPMHTLALYGAGASPFLEGLTMFAMGANIYFDKRKEFDVKHKISETIDKNKDLWTSYDKPLYRGVSTTQERLDNLKKGSAVSMNGLSSWSSKKDVADRFTKTSIFKRGNIPLVFIDKTKKHDKTLFYPFSSAMGFNTQYEYVQSGSNKYKITDVYKEGDVYYAEVESY